MRVKKGRGEGKELKGSEKRGKGGSREEYKWCRQRKGREEGKVR